MADLPKAGTGEDVPGPADVPGVAPGAVSPATYWRRRAVALVLGILVLGTLAWAVNGTVARGTGGRAAAAGAAHGHSSAGRSRQATHTSGGTTAGTSAPQRVDSSQHPSPPAHPGGSPSPSRQPTGTPAATSPPITGPSLTRTAHWCPAHDVTLSLFTPKYWYRRRQLPEFAVAIASLDTKACKYDIGTKHVSVAVAAGISRLWDSADCTPTSAASHVVVLAPGRPDLQWVTWDRKTASPGCTAAARTVRLGAYTATAFGHRVQSNTLIFVLGGKGVAVP